MDCYEWFKCQHKAVDFSHAGFISFLTTFCNFLMFLINVAFRHVNLCLLRLKF